MTVRRFVVDVVCSSAGALEEYSPSLYGGLVSIRYVKDDFADGVDFVLTNEDTGETLWSEEDVNASATRYPRAATHSTAGVAALYAASGTAIGDLIGISGDRVKIVVADGGDETSGAFHITIDG